MTVQYLHCLRNQRKACKCACEACAESRDRNHPFSLPFLARSDPLAVGQFIAGYSECIRQVQKFALIRNASSPKLGKTSFPSEIQDKLTAHLLSYLKTFSDDATRTLQTHSTSATPRCPSPPSGGLGSSDASGFGSGDGSPPSRQSTLSSFASPSPRSPGHDSMDSDDGDGTYGMYPPTEGSRRDLNNNGPGVWRPW